MKFSKNFTLNIVGSKCMQELYGINTMILKNILIMVCIITEHKEMVNAGYKYLRKEILPSSMKEKIQMIVILA